MGKDEELLSRLEEATRGRFDLAMEAGADCAIRLVGTDELAEHGLRLLRRHRLHAPEVPLVVVVPDDSDAILVRDCWREHAADVIFAGALELEIAAALDRALQRRSDEHLRASEEAQLTAEFGRNARGLVRALEQLREGYDETLGALVSALDLREQETACHSQRVALYSVLMGMELGIEGEELENLYRGALLHDIGKIGIPDAVLLKPGSFTDEEWEIMRRHTQMGGELLRHIRFLTDASDIPRAHHEAWDGSGYPEGLSSEDIPLHARIFAIVDAYDAIRSERPYKKALPHDEAIARLGRGAGSHLDPRIVELFVALPQQTWTQLAELVGDTLTFETAAAGCARVRSA